MYVLLFLITSFFQIHEFHVSQCEIQYRPGEAHVAVVMHLFIDDLELALNEAGYDSIYLCTEKEREDANLLIEEYINNHFQIRADDSSIPFQMIGKEVSEDLMAIWCYIEAVNVAPFQEVNIENKVLLEIFEDQKNIVSFEYVGQKKKHFLFDRRESKQKIQF
jgi:hypothetical protein